MDDKLKLLKAAQKSVSKDYGDSVVKWLADMSATKLDVISTGSIALDSALGTGGFVRGRIVEIYGRPASGKSSLALNAAACATRAGITVLYLDAERALNANMPLAFGVDPDKFLYTTCYSGEEGLDIMSRFIETGAIGLCIVDSITALLPSTEISSGFDSNPIGVHAKLISKLCRNFAPMLGKTNTLLLAINQIRSAIGHMGSYDITTGGSALPFYSSHRVKVAYAGTKQKHQIRDANGNLIGHRTKFEVVKNKFAPPFKISEADLIYGNGYEIYLELADLALETGLVDRAGAWYMYKEEKFQGKARLITALKTNKVLCKEILDAILDQLGLENTYIDFDAEE
jgi:recombination protein RecA